MARCAVEEGRRSVGTLRASAEAPESLDAAFARIPHNLGWEGAARMLISGRGDVRELPALVWHEAYRIGREAILNAYKHSGAEEIQVAIDYKPEGLRVCVGGKGRGTCAAAL